jgi:hypothetical protein
MSPAERMVKALRGHGGSCRCPAHEDTNPSLSVKDTCDGRALIPDNDPPGRQRVAHIARALFGNSQPARASRSGSAVSSRFIGTPPRRPLGAISVQPLFRRHGARSREAQCRGYVAAFGSRQVRFDLHPIMRV